MPGDNRVDDVILQYADSRSAEEISKMLGGLLSAAKVAERRKFLLTSRNPLDQAEQEELTFYKLRALLAELENQFFDVKTAQVQLTALKMLFDRVDKRRLATEDQLSRLYANQAQIMFDAIRYALAAVVKELNVDEERATLALREALPQAVLVLSERNAGEEIKE